MDRMERSLNVKAVAEAAVVSGEKEAERDLSPPTVEPKAKKPVAKKKTFNKKS
jgi:hypothetical protein|tara:strand:- start:37 stop:195 length:159 start_codon:yes stop_codon:yes gene_type:complete